MYFFFCGVSLFSLAIPVLSLLVSSLSLIHSTSLWSQVTPSLCSLIFPSPVIWHSWWSPLIQPYFWCSFMSFSLENAFFSHVRLVLLLLQTLLSPHQPCSSHVPSCQPALAWAAVPMPCSVTVFSLPKKKKFVLHENNFFLSMQSANFNWQKAS